MSLTGEKYLFVFQQLMPIVNVKVNQANIYKSEEKKSVITNIPRKKKQQMHHSERLDISVISKQANYLPVS